MSALVRASLMVAVGVCATGVNAEPQATKTLETKSYVVSVEQHCGEGSVTCERVRLLIKDKSKNLTFERWGTTVPPHCKKEGPCSLIGYEYARGKRQYYVSRNGYLSVVDGKIEVLQEKGEWR